MAKKKAKRESVGKIPPPYALAMVVCDAVHRDPGTGKLFILGAFTVMYTTEFPATLPAMGLYIELTNGRGLVPIRIQLVDAEEDRKPLLFLESQIEFPDPREIVQSVSTLQNVTFETPGEYRFQVFACNEFLMERRIIVAHTSGEVS